jgi:hypothetical protein
MSPEGGKMTCGFHRQPDSGDEERGVESFRYFPSFTGSTGSSMADPDWIGDDPVSEGVRGKRTALWGGRIQNILHGFRAVNDFNTDPRDKEAGSGVGESAWR